MKYSRSWLWLLSLVPLAVGAARLRFDVEIMNLLPERLDVARGLKVYQQNFSDARELIITLEAPTADEAESAARALAQLLSSQTTLVADVTWQPAWVESPVEAKPTIASYKACRMWLANIQRVVAEARRSGRLPANVELHYTGRPAFVTEIAGGMEDDMLGSCGGTLATIGILFWLTHRRLRP